MPPLSIDIELLRRQYLQLLNPKDLSIPHGSILKRPEIQSQIYTSMFRDDAVPYQPPARYRSRVLKLIVSALENAMSDPEEDEISNDLTSHLASTMSQPAETSEHVEAQRKSYVTYTAPASLVEGTSAPTIHLLESPSLLAFGGTTGLRTWEAAKYLASFLHSGEGAAYVRDKAVIELGAGTGLVSLFCARWFGAKYVLATDGSGEVVDVLGANVFLNGIRESEVMDATVVKWGHALDGELLKDPEGERRYELVVGTDVTFDDRLLTPLVSTLHELFERYHGIEALIAATVRNEETLDKFLQACCSRNFSHAVIASTQQDRLNPQLGLFYSLATEIRIYKLWRPDAL